MQKRCKWSNYKRLQISRNTADKSR